MVIPENWKSCEQMQVKNCRDCALQLTPQTCKYRIELLEKGVADGELYKERVESEMFYKQIW